MHGMSEPHRDVSARPRRWHEIRRRRCVRITVRTVAAITALGALLLAASITWTRIDSYGHIYSAADVPAAPVALVLGALVVNGEPSDFLRARLLLAEQLYDTGKVHALLVSGDNSRDNYDEPDIMREWLIAHGIPSVKIVTDYAGFDTYSSCVRARKVFGVTRAIVVSQTYHLPRAVSLCRQVGVVADGVGDATVERDHLAWLRADVREQVADVKAVWDVLTDRRPEFLGPQEPGVRAALAAAG
jgi:vancomycin permeability regulator SanA